MLIRMFERCLYFNTNTMVRQLNRVWDSAYQVAGLSAPHAYMLRLVCHQPEISQKQVANELNLEKSTVTRFVAVLVEKRLLKRRNGFDGREILLQPTAQGKRLGVQLDEIGRNLYKRMRKQLGADRFDSLVQALRLGANHLT